MRTPDKIYLDEDMIRYHVLSEKLNESDIEYIRKDALLEFLNGFDTSSRYERFVIDNLITRINSL